MKMLVLDGTPKNNYPTFNSKLNQYLDSLEKNINFKRITLKDLKLAFCNGCFNCWWKTPGICNIKDDIELVTTEIMKADRLLFASPMIHGFPSSLLKKVQDRLIPLLLPYIDLVDGECHHQKRYKHYPEIELYFGKEEDITPEDEHIVTDIYRRLAINFHSKIVKTQFV